MPRQRLPTSVIYVELLRTAKNYMQHVLDVDLRLVHNAAPQFFGSDEAHP